MTMDIKANAFSDLAETLKNRRDLSDEAVKMML